MRRNEHGFVNVELAIGADAVRRVGSRGDGRIAVLEAACANGWRIAFTAYRR